MPSSSPKQARFMAAVAHDPKFAAKVGVGQSIGKEFNQADAGTGILSNNRRDTRSQFHSTVMKDPKE